MSSCLGLYVEENLIKYAKVSKEHDLIKVESYGVNFYESIEKAIQQIVEETFSYKTPISINLSGEIYNYFDMFSLLNKKDLAKAISTEFESYCTEKGYNPNVFETRYALVNNTQEKDKFKVIHVDVNKIELNKRMQQVEEYKLTNISPLPIDITNIVDAKENENVVIVNIEETTSVTTVIDQKIYDVKILETGSKQILDKINMKENSYSKSYDICKNTTIYTSEGKELQDSETGYLEDIMPTLYEIVGQVRKILNESMDKISKVYITGTGALINNIDLYFQEYLLETGCEVLKPYFIENTGDVNVKDYIEVNSAIALALAGLGEGVQGMNFKKLSLKERLPEWMTMEIGGNSGKVGKKASGNLSGWFTNDLGQKLNKVEINLLRTAVGLLIVFFVYSGFSGLLNNQMQKKEAEVDESIANTNRQIALAETDNSKIKSKTNDYTTMVQNLQDINDKIADAQRTRNVIPNLLNSIMYIVPENVQITSIENTTDKHIVIEAKSDKYEQLGYLKAKLKSDVILTNVISTAGQKQGNAVTVRIEGDLP